MSLDAGTRLGPYEILAPLGAGRMGEVYRARDTRLSREVAIKVLPAEVSEAPRRLKRFETEARAASALNHPNIVTIYDFGIAGSISYIAMERVDGTTLRELALGGALPTRKLLQIATQIAEGLAKAHGAGIVHRDLKPENVMVTRDGIVKLLDFGLAKLVASEGEIGDAPNLPSATGTNPGVVLGTAVYMSPEQASAAPLDFRSDQFSLGSILYELATGRQPFKRATALQTLTAVVQEEPAPIAEINPAVPAPLRWIMERCLEKEPSARYASTEDLARELAGVQRRLAEIGASGAMTPIARGRRSLLAWVAVGAVALIALATTIGRFRSSPVDSRRFQTSLLPPEQTLFTPEPAPVAISPDGSTVVFGARGESQGEALFVRVLAQGAARRLPGTENAAFPFWSPNGQAIGFFSDHKLKTVDVVGGLPRTVCDAASGQGGTWGPGGVILFAPNNNGPVLRVSDLGGEPAPVTRLDGSRKEYGHRWPQFLPDGRHFLYQSSTTSGSLGAAIRVASLGSEQNEYLAAARSMAIYSPPGYLLFMGQQGLVAQPFDAVSLRTRGAAIPIATEDEVLLNEHAGFACFSVARTGLLAYQTFNSSARLTWFDRQGRALGTIGRPGDNYGPRISPDGQRVAVQSGQLELTRDVETRLSPFGEWPVWSPDGRRTVHSFKGDLYLKSATDTTEQQLLLHSTNELYPDDWSPDGRFILYQESDPKTWTDLWVLPLDGDRKPRPLLRTDAIEEDARFSPDGRWVAYTSNEDFGESGVYVTAFPGPGDRWKVAKGAGHPVWRRDGRELFYIGESQLMAVDVVVAGSSFRTSEPRPLFPWPSGDPFDVSADGQRFLMTVQDKTARPDPITLVQNWDSGPKP